MGNQGSFFSIPTINVNHLINKIDTGYLGVPELQRPFVWERYKVRNLFDSMMRGYPIGYIMLWNCYDKSKLIGVDNRYLSPKQVIIDGQQRLTSLYAVMKGKKVLNSNYKEKEIIISYCPLRDEFKVGDNATKRDPEWIYNLSELFTLDSDFSYIEKFIQRLKDYRASKKGELSDDEEHLIGKRLGKVYSLKSFQLPVIQIEEDVNEEDVAEIFVRVNSSGTNLQQDDFILTLLSVYLPECRREIEKFCKESQSPAQDKKTAYNLITEVKAQDIIRVVMAYAFARARLSYGYKLLRGADFEKQGAIDDNLREQRLKVFEGKLGDVLKAEDWHNFLIAIRNAGYVSIDHIRSRNAIFYCYALYLIAKHKFNAKLEENQKLTSLWFFCTLLTSLYTTESVFENQLNSIKEMTTFAEYKDYILSRVNERLTNDYFNVTLVGSDGLDVSASKTNNAWNAYLASLIIAWGTPLFTTKHLFMEELLHLDGSKKALEKHHLFPKAYLSNIGFGDKKINQMANYELIDWTKNIEISDKAPADYVKELVDKGPSVFYPVVCEKHTEEEMQKMEEEHALPHGWENMEYENFLVERRKLMAAKIKEAFEELKRKAI